MKSLLSIFVVLFGLNAFAEHELGFVLGTASGLSGMVDLNQNRAVDFAIAFNSDSKTHVYADYLFNNARTYDLKGSATPMTLYYGLGLRMYTKNGGKRDGDTYIGPRAPIGLHYKIVNPDVSLFGEIAPVVNLTPEGGVDITAGIGARIRF